jgi:Ca2+-binding EF-hand superfamily protein
VHKELCISPRAHAAPSPAAFCQIVAHLLLTLNSPKATTQLFAKWDSRNSGRITVGQLREIFGRMTPTPLTGSTLDDLVQYADPGETGLVNYKDLCDRLFADNDKIMSEEVKEKPKAGKK